MLQAVESAVKLVTETSMLVTGGQGVDYTTINHRGIVERVMQTLQEAFPRNIRARTHVRIQQEVALLRFSFAELNRTRRI